ncbi:MAG TPA: hypothetical protein VMC41_01755 [Candidatus Nanoarchaeia archaeon]|nr:hypothetical protein [Candidatus Nanoarchaeia archaeon]
MEKSTAESSSVRIINANSPCPEIIGLPEEEETIFFGRILTGIYCAITAAKEQKNFFEKQSMSFGETEIVKAKIYYFQDSAVDCRPVVCGAKVNDLWFCRTREIKDASSRYDQFNLSSRGGVPRLNGMEFEEIFKTF